MTRPKDNLLTIPFTREMLTKQVLEKALDSLGEMEYALVLARDKDGDLLMFHSCDDRAQLIDMMEECKFALFSGDFFDA